MQKAVVVSCATPKTMSSCQYICACVIHPQVTIAAMLTAVQMNVARGSMAIHPINTMIQHAVILMVVSIGGCWPILASITSRTLWIDATATR